MEQEPTGRSRAILARRGGLRNLVSSDAEDKQQLRPRQHGDRNRYCENGTDAIHKIFQFNSEKNCLNTDNKRTSLVIIGPTAIKVTRMISTRSKKPLPLILVEVPKDQRQIFVLRSVCHLLIVVERPHKKGTTAIRGFTTPSGTVAPTPSQNCPGKVRQLQLAQTPPATGDAPSSLEVIRGKNPQTKANPVPNKSAENNNTHNTIQSFHTDNVHISSNTAY
ncbi:hypothetical protein GEV33_005572 [Tenebrio molitor]|uniref:Pre-C2HC domain-containing protein n=1 Tax=Tenebrio molitor TaxID=7067 RepID=A0A8J6HM85_TENMO|nr:hypothetical protein GEV33_005572 [Tenebrio molitor]